jgi:O-antigen/teichoic acid export membrane protein
LKKILAKFSRVAKTDFVKVSSWSAISTLVKMVVGFVSTKVAAWTIGTAGMGIVGNFLNSVNIMSMLGTGGIGQGVTKYVAEYYASPEEQKKIIGHAARITLVSTLVVCILVVCFSRQYTYYIFKDYTYTSIVVLFGCSIFLYSFNMLFVYIINGFKEYRKFVRINILSSLLALLVSVILVLNFGLYGALLAAVASQSVIILVTLLFVYKTSWFRDMFRPTSIEWKYVRLLAGFTVMTVVSTIMLQYSQLSIRTYISLHLSPHAAGLWESMNRISAMYLMVVTTSISTFYLPRLAELREDSLLRREIHKTMKIVLPPLLLVCLLIFLARDLIVWILFTPEFYQVRELFAFQMIGDFFKIGSWLIAFLFWAKAMTRTFIITEVLFSLSLMILARVFINQYGLVGSAYAYAVNYLLYTIVIAVIFKKLLFGREKK